MLYEDVDIIVRQRRLTCETTVKEVLTAMINELLTDYKTIYKVAYVTLKDYPQKITVVAIDKDSNEPDEDDLGLNNEGHNKLRELLDSLSDLTGARWVGFPGYYYSK